MKVAIIPARGGSKRISRKNIKFFCGMPIISWPIAAALESKCFDRVIVSTDDPDIAEIAINCGAEIPFLRPSEIAGDHTPTGVVVSHVLSWLGERGALPSLACCIYPTAPFLLAEDVQSGLNLITSLGVDFVVSVTSFDFPIQRACKIKNGRLVMVDESKYLTRSQDLEETYHDAGQLYWGRSEAWLAGRPIFGEQTAPLILPRYRVQDIDTTEDWTRAEWLFKAIRRDADQP